MTQPNQSAVQQSIRDMTGTALTFEGDWLALFDDASIAAGTFNERQLAWLNEQLGVTYSNLSEARQAYAELLGYNNWDQTRDVMSTATPFAATAMTSASLRIDTDDASTVVIDWGDGTVVSSASGATASHTYGSAFTGDVKVTVNSGASMTRWQSSASAGTGWSFGLSDLPASVTFFGCFGSNTVSGNLSDLPVDVTVFQCFGLNTVSGALSGLPTGVTFFECSGLNIVSGNLSDLPAGVTFFRCLGSNTVTITGSLPQSTMRILEVRGTGLSASIVDDILIAAAAISTWTNEKIVNLSGNNDPRTSASDAAVTTLQGLGVTVTTS